ncbi:hypothetical protein [Nocardioides aquiterrae]|uniref:Uncharacterized protein n=1 Tax=Nocardioides aquiterrae TaxID=203799 RepID=A0ABN1UR10_9ACTN
MIRRIAAGLVLLVGAFWLVSTFALGYSGKTAAVDDMTGDFRPVFSDAGLKQTNADIDTVNAFAAQFQKEAVPALAQQLGMTPDEFVGTLGKQYPDVGAGMQQLPESLPYFNGMVDQLNQQQGNFHDADAIPTGFLPAKTVHWLFVALGIVAVGLGLSLLRTSAGRRLLIGVVALGVAVVAVTFVLSVPQKAQAVDDMTGAFRPVFTDAGAQQTRDYLTTIQKMDDQLNAEALAGLATMLGVTPDQLATSLGEQFPAVGAGLQKMPDILARFDTLVTKIENNVDTFQQADAIPTESKPTTWLVAQLLVPAGILILAGGGGLLASRRRVEGARSVRSPDRVGSVG